MQKMAAEEPAVFAGLGSAKAGTPERKAALDRLRDLIAATQNYAGVTGSITLDANRNASKPAVVIRDRGRQEGLQTRPSIRNAGERANAGRESRPAFLRNA